MNPLILLLPLILTAVGFAFIVLAVLPTWSSLITGKPPSPHDTQSYDSLT
jgi:hypothetical protein